MQGRYHVAITRDALGARWARADLELVIRANLGQDRLAGLLWHPEYHCDDSRFAETESYIARQRALFARFLQEVGMRDVALSALGRLLHARQDLYAHSNWVALWVEGQGGLDHCVPRDTPPCQDPLSVAQLRSGGVNLLAHALYALPMLGRWLANRHAFPTSHAAAHLDDPGRGPLFHFAFAAATKHSRLEFEALARSCAGSTEQLNLRPLSAHSSLDAGGPPES